MGSTREDSVDRVGTDIFHPIEGFGLFVEDISKMFVLYCLREEDGSFLCGRESVERGGLP